ncbi:MAG: sulfotransferase [Caulobacteraceae bacterium]|nr:sulfotransferase [Caulobacteraceae bacterium]
MQSLAELVLQAPDWAEAHFQAAIVQLQLARADLALTSLRAALELDPEHAAAANQLGMTLYNSDRVSEAMLWLSQAVALEPENGTYHRDLGRCTLSAGEVEKGRAALIRAYELDPTLDMVLFTLVRITPMDDGSPTTATLWSWLNAAAQDRNAPPMTRSRIALAMGKALDDVGRHRQAFEAFAQGAELARLAHEYNIEAAEDQFGRIEALFDIALMRRLEGQGEPSDRPVFIVGMPRSGSTLVETILAAHPKVHAGGELDAMLDLVSNSRGAQGEAYPDWAASLNGQDCQMLGKAYLERCPRGVAGKRRVTDKQLLNVAHVGLIHLILPNAKLIHIRRDPRDQALSCYSLGFNHAPELGYVNDLEHFGRYWRAYDRLMAHWKQVLPEGVMLEIPYEGLVGDLETCARRMVAHCGLEWSPACLNFHNTRRSVRTASAAQVRQPIYDHAVGRWKPYAAQLAPAFKAMGLEDEPDEKTGT